MILDGPPDSPRRLVLAHGAGAPGTSDWMARAAAGLARRGVRVARFDFPYMEAGRKVPDRPAVLLDTWRRVYGELGPGWAVGGKSMGGRMASMLADELGAPLLVCLGYPFHPPGRPEKLRTQHLEHLDTPTLIVQGTRDPFGTREEVQGYRLSPAIRVHWIEGSGHDLKPLDEALDAVAAFLAEVRGGET